MLVLAAAPFLSATVACASRPLPDPKSTVAAFAAAAERGDAAAMNALMTADTRRDYGVEGTRRLLAEARDEIAHEARETAHAVVHAVAEVPYVDGERATLVLEDGHYRISAASGLPAGARTPADALGELRIALAGRDYPALVRVLSADTRNALEADMRSIVVGLDHPDSLEVKVHGETAEVNVPGGHKVTLRREAGVWTIHDFD